jgi:hypothetical protein
MRRSPLTFSAVSSQSAFIYKCTSPLIFFFLRISRLERQSITVCKLYDKLCCVYVFAARQELLVYQLGKEFFFFNFLRLRVRCTPGAPCISAR